MTEASDQETFEDAVAQLEAIVARMEEGTLTLDESLRHFEQAVALSRYCAGKLETAEKQVAVLLGDQDGPVSADLSWLEHGAGS